MDTINSFVSERSDDLPLLLELLKTLEVPQILDQNLKVHGNRKGVSYGWESTIWLAHILSQGDHRMNKVQLAVEKSSQTINACIPIQMNSNDFTDDRLADILKALSDDKKWDSIQNDLNRNSIKVYELSTDVVRLDTTTVTVDTDQRGLLRLGHSKDHRSDVPQIKVMMASLDPLAMPLVTQVIAGNCADDPLYIPAIQKVRASLGKKGLLYVGDCKMASLATRKEIARGEDFYLCPLSVVQMPLEQLKNRLIPVLKEKDSLQKDSLEQVLRPDSKGEVQLIAEGFQWIQTQQHDDLCWQERHLLIRSVGHRRAASENLDRHLSAACQEITKLGERGKGKRPPRDPVEFQEAVNKILNTHCVEGLIDVNIQVETTQKTIRAYKSQDERIEILYNISVCCSIDIESVEYSKEFLGCRVFVTNLSIEKMSLADSVLIYRDEYRIESNFGRLKGKILSISPMYLQREDHIKGLVRLLSIALRVLTLLEYVVRRSLERSGESLCGLYAGNAKRATARPTAELLLEAFKYITLLVIPQGDNFLCYLNPLPDLPQKILELLGYSIDVYGRLASNLGITPGK